MSRKIARRETELASIARDDLEFRDAYSATSGRDDLAAHLVAVQKFMPGMVLARDGEVRQCQGTVVAGWVIRAPDGATRGQGTNVFDFGPDGRIARVVGLWGPAR